MLWKTLITRHEVNSRLFRIPPFLEWLSFFPLKLDITYSVLANNWKEERSWYWCVTVTGLWTISVNCLFFNISYMKRDERSEHSLLISLNESLRFCILILTFTSNWSTQEIFCLRQIWSICDCENKSTFFVADWNLMNLGTSSSDRSGENLLFRRY